MFFQIKSIAPYVAPCSILNRFQKTVYKMLAANEEYAVIRTVDFPFSSSLEFICGHFCTIVEPNVMSILLSALARLGNVMLAHSKMLNLFLDLLNLLFRN